MRQRTQSNPDADGNRVLVRPNLDRQSQGLLDSFGDVARFPFIPEARQQNRELVAADPSNRVSGASRVLQAVGDSDENLIADTVAHPVIQLLEVIDIEIQQRETLVWATVGPRSRALELSAEVRSVRKICKGIVPSIMLEPIFVAFAVSNVGQPTDEPDGVA